MSQYGALSQITFGRTRRRLQLCGAAALVALSAAPAKAADDGWDLSGSMRLRYEAVTNQVRPGFNRSDDLVSVRTTLAAERKAGPLRLVGEIYDSRAYGANRRTPISTNEVNTFEVVQAYAAVEAKTEPFGKVTLAAGRFMLNLGSRRLVAADDYRNTTNSYTGVRADLAPWGVRTTLIYMQPQLRLPDALESVLDNSQRIDHEGRDLELWGGIAAKPKAIGDATLEGGYFHLSERDRPNRPTRNRQLDTFSARVIVDPRPGRFDYELEAIGQTGTIRAGTRPTDAELKVRAGFVHADAGYTFRHSWKPRLSVEFDAATGDKAGGRYGRFDTLFGMRRADLAPSGLYNAIARTNLLTPGVRLEIAPSPAWDAFGAARAMWLEAPEDSFSTTGVRDPAGRSGRYAGAQVEGRVRYWLIKDRARLEANAVWLDKGRFLRTAPNAPRSGDERYISLNTLLSF
ncbi:alginate export family protein [Phenylobacterium sp.]|jgi:hypothetical protein|uniref:alginate export family protein n=1 Tax=Phenylobacterium sp. TaxID=1871053 RepID=UPI0037844233